jgi:hypothetical protein
MTLRAAS